MKTFIFFILFIFSTITKAQISNETMIFGNNWYALKIKGQDKIEIDCNDSGSYYKCNSFFYWRIDNGGNFTSNQTINSKNYVHGVFKIVQGKLFMYKDRPDKKPLMTYDIIYCSKDVLEIKCINDDKIYILLSEPIANY